MRNTEMEHCLVEKMFRKQWPFIIIIAQLKDAKNMVRTLVEGFYLPLYLDSD